MKCLSTYGIPTPWGANTVLGPCGTYGRDAYSIHIEIEYDARKAKSDLKKHGIGFEEAATALLDPQALAMEDECAEEEARWVLIGMSAEGRLLTVVYTLREEDRIRLISARKATRKEAKCYG